MDNRAPQLWDGNREAPKGLRLPNTSPSRLLEETKKATNTKVQTSLEGESKMVTSRLSADAPEFIPSGFYTIPVTNTSTSSGSVQDRLKKFKVSDSNSAQQPVNDSSLECDFIGSPDDTRLRHLIVTLTKDPGQFSDLVDLFIDTLYPHYDDILVLSRAADLLVEQAIEYASFRYTAARLCYFIEQCCPNFRAELHLTCQKKLKSTSHKSGLILFVAEVYIQLEYQIIYGTYLFDAYKILLDIGGNENVKSVCQALKLTGYSLEQQDKKALDEVFLKLNEIKSTVTGTALNLIDSVINLRSSQWGRNNQNNSSSNSESETAYWNEVPNTEFYSPDGSKFTSEENEFLAANMNSTEEYLTDVSDPDELCDPEPEMDEEIQAAFKDFVKLSKR